MSPDFSRTNHRDQAGRQIVLCSDGLIRRPRRKPLANITHLFLRQLSSWVLLSSLAGITATASASEILGTRTPLQVRDMVMGSHSIQVIHIMVGRRSGTDPFFGDKSVDKMHALLALGCISTIVSGSFRQFDIDVSVVFAVALQFAKHAAISGDEIVVVRVHRANRNGRHFKELLCQG